jgi:hypothetical protein
MSPLVALLCMLAFSPRASGQTQVQKVPLVLTWNYDAQEKKLTLHLANNSGKDITAYTFSMAEKYTDGSTNPYYAEGIRHDIRDSERMEDLLGLMITVQQARGTSEEERMRREYGNGTFAAGTTRDQNILETKDISDVQAIVDVVIYADGTKDVENEDALKRIWASRQRALLATQKISQIVQNVLADQTDHPVAAALAELSRVAAEMTQYSVEAGGRGQGMYDIQQGQEPYLQNGMQTLKSLQQLRGKATERERLAQYAESLEKTIKLMAPHCELVPIVLMQ